MSNNDTVVISKVNLFKVGTIQDLEANKSIVFDIPESAGWKGRSEEIAILKYKNTIFAIDNRCPHQGGPLNLGDIEDVPNSCAASDKEERKLAIVCPWHGWSFFLDSGACTMIEGLELPIFKVQTKNDDIYVEIPSEIEVDF